MCSKANLLTLGCSEGKYIYCRTPVKENRQLMLKRPELLDGFQERGFKGSVRGGCRVCDQLVHNSQTGWHQGEVSSIINLLFSTSLGSMFSQSAVFIWWGSASFKNNLGICVKPLSVSFRELGVWWFCYVVDLLSKLSPVSQPDNYSLFLHLHISWSLTLESVFWDSREAWDTKAKAFYFKGQGHKGLYTVSKNSSYLPHNITGRISPKISPNRKILRFNYILIFCNRNLDLLIFLIFHMYVCILYLSSLWIPCLLLLS